jgi:hypothetical protein
LWQKGSLFLQKKTFSPDTYNEKPPAEASGSKITGEIKG